MNDQPTAATTTFDGAHSSLGTGRRVAFAAIAGAVAATASFLALTTQLPVWAMFVGWVAWFLRPTSVRDSVSSIACLWAGLVLAVGAQAAIGALAPALGAAAFPLVVFFVAMFVVGLQGVPVFGNPLGWFLGLISSFALHAPDAFPGLFTLVGATAIGAVAGFAGQRIQKAVA
jgi:hypothetical protein